MSPTTRNLVVWTGVAWLASLGLIGAACSPGPLEESRKSEMVVDGVRVDPSTQLPVVLLRERGPSARILPIWIGFAEARSIAQALEAEPAMRPNAHDLIRTLLAGLDGIVKHVVVTELRDTTYYATIVLDVDGKRLTVDSRPSDAIAVALRVGAPVFATEKVLRDSNATEGQDVLFREEGPRDRDREGPASESGSAFAI